MYDKVFLLSDAEANLFFSSDAVRIISGTPNDVPSILGDHDNAGWKLEVASLSRK